LAQEIVIEVFRGLSLNILMDGKRVGFVDAWEDEKVDKGVWVEYVYILERLRNSGIGSNAVKMVLERWREMGYETVSLDDVHWDKPVDFWGKLGFQGEGKRKKLVLKEDR